MKLKTALVTSFSVAASVVGASAVEEPPHQWFRVTETSKFAIKTRKAHSIKSVERGG